MGRRAESVTNTHKKAIHSIYDPGWVQKQRTGTAFKVIQQKNIMGSGARGRAVGTAGPSRAAASWSTAWSVLWRSEAPLGRQLHACVLHSIIHLHSSW